MPARVTIRRLNLRGLAPRDHPAPNDLGRQLADAAQRFLPEALEDAVSSWSGDAVLRLRRLEVDVTLDAAFEPKAFAACLARAIALELRRTEECGSSEGVMCYASRAIYLAALLEALVEGRAQDRWWLRDAEGLRFLTPSQAIRTATLADARTGLEALASLPLPRRLTVLRALTPLETERMLKAFARLGGAASLRDCAELICLVEGAIPEGASALAVYIEVFTRRPALAGEALAAAARLWTEIDKGAARQATREGTPFPLTEQRAPFAPTAEAEARRILAEAAVRRNQAASRAEPDYHFTPFGGLLMLLPDLGATDIIASTSPDMAQLVTYAALGLCVGRDRFREYLADVLWRELFGLDPRMSVSAVDERLSTLDENVWSRLEPLAAPLGSRCDARFLLAPRRLITSRRGARVLAGLARAASKRFARQLLGFNDASAPFLWANVLAVSAALERRSGGWNARLSRARLDVVVSLARVAEGSVYTPAGLRIDIARTPA